MSPTQLRFNAPLGLFGMQECGLWTTEYEKYLKVNYMLIRGNEAGLTPNGPKTCVILNHGSHYG